MVANAAYVKQVPRKSRSQATSVGDFIARGGDLSLREWLQISWFYPHQFFKESIRETANSILVFSSETVLKFPKVADATPPEQTFAAKWRAVCEEYCDNADLASELYLGYFIVRFIDGEPQWQEYRHFGELISTAIPEGDEVALLLRRIPDVHLLSHQLARGRSVGVSKFGAVARALSSFQEAQRAASKLGGDTHQPNGIKAFFSAAEHIRLFAQEYSNYLDPFSQIALEQAASFVCSYVRTRNTLLEQRIAQGLTIDGHGSLRSDHIRFERNHGNGQQLRAMLFGRSPRRSITRFSDVLSDVASLAVDLEMREHRAASLAFEEAYFLRNGGILNRGVYQFFVATHALLHARYAFHSLHEDAIEAATKAVTVALRAAVNLRYSFIVTVVGESEFATNICSALAALLGVTLVKNESTQWDLGFEQCIEQIRIAEQNKDGVVLYAEQLSEMQAARLQAVAAQHGTQYLIVDCDRSNTAVFDNEFSAARTRYGLPLRRFPLGQGLSIPDTAFWVLRSISPNPPTSL